MGKDIQLVLNGEEKEQEWERGSKVGLDRPEPELWAWFGAEFVRVEARP